MILIGDLFLMLGVLLLLLAFLALVLPKGDRLASSHDRLTVATLGTLGLSLGMIFEHPEWGDRPLLVLLLVSVASAAAWPIVGSAPTGGRD